MPRRNDRRTRCGVALAAAVFAVAVIGGLVAGSLLLGILEQRSGRSSWYLLQATEAAEGELRAVVHNTIPDDLQSLPIGGAALDLGVVSPYAGIRVERQVRRVTQTLFLISSQGFRLDADGAVLASRRVGMLVWQNVDSPDRLRPIGQRAWVQLY